MEQFFKIRERGSTVSTEVLGGLTTFLAMAYIVAVNPAILADAGVPFEAGLTATCLGAAVMTVAMGLIANRPVALASGMGINAIVAYGLCGSLGIDWRVAMAVVFLEGVVILGLVLGGLRKAVMDAIPVDLRHAIGIGIGLFIAFIGLKGAGLVIADDSTLVALGELSEPGCVVALVSLVCAVIFQIMGVRGGLLISIVVAVIVGIPLGVTALPTSWSFGLDFTTFAAPFQMVDGQMAIVQVFLQPALLLFVFSLLMSDFFDTMGTVVAIGKQGDFADAKGDVKDIQPILAVDSSAAIVGGFFGASSITCFVESASGVAEGARTGLSNLVVGALFLVCAFLAPLFGMVSGPATCGALVVVGFLMMTDVGAISWKEPELAFPAFLVIVGIPFTYSITNGIGLGFIAYVILMVARGRVAEVKPLMWVAALAFLAMFIFV
ncbi:NCS2 family permease [Adlercreutzia faecimuris]|uniref:NCS2 family permease n=1 Tax=Adlercreutzia faecimuris TaxID=2897341 RepID=A0ABS9WHY3_9ACTN|nr:NCS2 family permease [Adlercreutzia sp. JBNU-10]MCI2242057.1 NCS2 family permease [Adlercreutzia sp. JBNU-10]